MINSEEGFFKFEQGKELQRKKLVLRNTLTALEIVAEISDIVINYHQISSQVFFINTMK